ncbi:hypothetical protein T08_746 [Trichinella sp. T8]|nr:hypothetical protein T08_746 [Trichinella sp. T8]
MKMNTTKRSRFQATPASNTLFRSSVKAKINDVADRTRRRILDVVCQVSTSARDTYRHTNAE